MRRAMPVYGEQGIVDLPRLYINGGKRGYIISLATVDALRLLQPIFVSMVA